MHAEMKLCDQACIVRTFSRPATLHESFECRAAISFFSAGRATAYRPLYRHYRESRKASLIHEGGQVRLQN